MPYLVVSLYTLRQHWQGSIDVYAWDGEDGDSFRLAERVGRDDRLNVCVLKREPEYRGKNAQFIDKIKLVSTRHPDDTILYLDADTSIHGDLERLFDEAERTGFCCTQFCKWVSTGVIPKGRIRRLRDFPGIDQEAIQTVTTRRWPSLNGGVFACKPTSEVLPIWQRWTWMARSVFIADEAVLHLLPAVFGPEKVAVLTGGEYNCSTFVKWFPQGLDYDQVRVWHYHGDSNVREQKSPWGYRQWKTLYSECLERNLGGMREWIREAVRANKHMARSESIWLAGC